MIYFVTYKKEESSFSLLIKRINSRVQLHTLVFFIHISFYTKQLLEIDPSQSCDCTADIFSVFCPYFRLFLSLNCLCLRVFTIVL